MPLLLDRPQIPAGGYPSLLSITHERTAISQEARSLRFVARQLRTSGERSVALFGEKETAISELFVLVAESREADEEDAIPISDRSAELTADFIRALPNRVPLPELSWEPNGSVSLDWIRSRYS